MKLVWKTNPDERIPPGRLKKRWKYQVVTNTHEKELKDRSKNTVIGRWLAGPNPNLGCKLIGLECKLVSSVDAYVCFVNYYIVVWSINFQTFPILNQH